MAPDASFLGWVMSLRPSTAPWVQPQRLKPIPLRRYQAFALPIIGRAKTSARWKRCHVCCAVRAGFEPLLEWPLIGLPCMGDESSAIDSTLGTVTTAQAGTADTVPGFRPTDRGPEPVPNASL
jgi:hypothetical protein